MTMTSEAELEAHDLRSAACHEAGHCVVAEHFGLKTWAILIPAGKPTRAKVAWTGKCGFSLTTAFRTAVVGWAGVAAGWTDDELQQALEDDLFLLEDALSVTDRTSVEEHPQRRRTFRCAMNIIIRRRSRLAEWAAALEKQGRTLQATGKCEVVRL